MAYNPSAPIVIKVEINAGALGWVDVTARGRAASCVIQQGRTGGAIQAEPSQLKLILGNPDGYLTEDNAVSPYYGSWGRGCEIRVSRIGLTVSPAERFHGQIDTLVEHYPGGNVDATVEVTAVGTLGILTQGSDPLRSPLTRAMDGVSAGDFVPVAHWPMEESSDATQLGNLRAGSPATVSGSVSLASYSGASGSKPVPAISTGGQIAGVFPPIDLTPDSAGRSAWQVQFQGMIPSSISADAVFLVLNVNDTGGDHIVKLQLEWLQASTTLECRAYDRSGSRIGSTGLTITPTLRDQPLLIGFTLFQSVLGAPVSFSLVSLMSDGSGPAVGATPGPGLTVVLPAPQSWRAVASAGNTGWSFSHFALYTGAELLDFPNQTDNAAAIAGYTGELAADRMIRLCREEGVSFELTGSAADTQPMGPQLIDTLVANLRDCETADQGLVHDNGADGAIGYVTLTHLYNQTATVTVVSGSLEPGLEAIRDSQYVRNDITSTRPNGGFAHVADENHIAKIRARLKDDRQPNVETDEQLPNDAGWALRIGTAPGARYDTLGINLRNSDGALLADAVETHKIGDRITVASTALPPQHPIDGIDGLTVGWTELLDADTWIFRPNVVPYRHEVFTIGDQTRGRLDTAGCLLYEAATASATSLKLHTYSGPAWITSASRAADFTSGFTLGAAGEQIRPTAMAAVTAPSFVGVGTASSGSSGPRTPGLPAGAASGDLVLVFASTRNSGTGVVDTPANWTSLLTFGNCQLMGRIYDGAWSMPTVTYTGGAVSEDTIAQSLALRGMCPDLSKIVVGSQPVLNGSVQDIAYPTLPVRQNTCIVLFLGWKQDDYTSVATVSGATEAQEASSTAGNDASQVWDYIIQSAQADIPVGAFVVTGGAAAISRGATVALVGGYQIATVARAVNGVSKAQVAGEAVSLWKPVAIAL